jgi:hypothetical protein
MARRSFTEFLLSKNATASHLLFITVVVVFSFCLWSGAVRPEFGWILLITVVGYLPILALMWWYERLEEQAMAKHVVESITAPEKLRRKRRWWRRASLAALMGLAAVLVYFGNRGFRLHFIPAQYVGYFFLGFAALGALSVNIWYGGPLDPRMDPPPAADGLDSDAPY